MSCVCVYLEFQLKLKFSLSLTRSITSVLEVNASLNEWMTARSCCHWRCCCSVNAPPLYHCCCCCLCLFEPWLSLWSIFLKPSELLCCRRSAIIRLCQGPYMCAYVWLRPLQVCWWASVCRCRSIPWIASWALFKNLYYLMQVEKSRNQLSIKIHTVRFNKKTQSALKFWAESETANHQKKTTRIQRRKYHISNKERISIDSCFAKYHKVKERIKH